MAFGIHYAEVELRVCVSLVCGQTIPLHGLFVVLRDTVALLMHEANGSLRLSVSLICRQTEPFY